MAPSEQQPNEAGEWVTQVFNAPLRQTPRRLVLGPGQDPRSGDSEKEKKKNTSGQAGWLWMSLLRHPDKEPHRTSEPGFRVELFVHQNSSNSSLLVHTEIYLLSGRSTKQQPKPDSIFWRSKPSPEPRRLIHSGALSHPSHTDSSPGAGCPLA